MVKTCAYCGQLFRTESHKARFCSTRCRVAAHRRKKRDAPIVPSAQIKPPPGTVDDVRLAVGMARTASNDLARLAGTAPWQLRPGCHRISRAISDAVDAEGW